jgi:hypothetical protein
MTNQQFKELFTLVKEGAVYSCNINEVCFSYGNQETLIDDVCVLVDHGYSVVSAGYYRIKVSI